MCARNTRRADCNFYKVIVISCLFVTAPLLDIKDIIPSRMEKNRNKLSFTSSVALLDYECKYNKRVKYFVDDNGEFVPLQVMYSRRFIFNPDRVEKSDITRRVEHKNDWNNILDEMYGYSGNVPLLADKSAENLERSKRRAKSKLVDYILCNPFDLFCTLTLNGDEIDRTDYNAVIKKLNTYLDNRVRRKGLKYIGVPELHKKGGIHFHFLCNSEAMNLTDSGTVSCKGHKKPIKIATADRLKIPVEERQTVYNICDWLLGFTTAIKTYGNKMAVANYVGKYITKGSDKVGGRWYYSGGNLKTPVYDYGRVSFDDVTEFDYEFKCDGGEFKVIDYLKENKIDS